MVARTAQLCRPSTADGSDDLIHRSDDDHPRRPHPRALRPPRLCGLRWSNVDLEQGKLRIDSSLYAAEGGGGAMKDTKNHSRRDVALDPLTADALARHRQRMAERAESCGTRLRPEAFVFSDSADGVDPWLPDRASHAWDRLRKRTGLTGVRLHDLRHFQATMLLKAGVPVANVSKRIGHRDAATTLNVYAQFLEEVDRKSADIIGDLFGGPSQPTPSVEHRHPN